MSVIWWYCLQETVDSIMAIVDKQINKISKNIETKLIKKINDRKQK